jgi:hypothetical protein
MRHLLLLKLAVEVVLALLVRPKGEYDKSERPSLCIVLILYVQRVATVMLRAKYSETMDRAARSINAICRAGKAI